MANFKGTKGEWAIQHGTHRAAIYVGGTKAICDVLGNSVSSVTNSEMQANAKLIAAAPEMLDMLIEISKNIYENRGVNYMIELMGREYYDKIQNLIKKATE